MLSIVMAPVGMWACGSIASPKKSDQRPVTSESAARGEETKTGEGMLGHRVIKVGGCLYRSGVRLAPRNRAKPEVLLGGREVVDRRDAPMTPEEYQSIVMKCESSRRR